MLLAQPKLAKLAAVQWLPSDEREFLQQLIPRLTPAEKRYLDWELMPRREGAPPCPFRDRYARHLKCRILRKARDLLRED